MNRTSGSPKKASLVAFHDSRTGAPAPKVGMFVHCSPAELFMAKREGGAAAARLSSLGTAATIPIGAKRAIEPIT
jgi:hypothetical protein